jgi:membrane associated rhomboid family serine protease
MGINDRDYVREEPRHSLLSDRSVVINLILLNCLIFLGNYLFGDHDPREGDWLTEVAGLNSGLLKHPWMAWQLVTYGFLHSWDDLRHIAFNMFGLWMFGREIEDIYGRKEFLRLYLLLIVGSGLIWVAAEAVAGSQAVMIGASGAVVGVTMLFVLHFPKRIIMLFGFIPLPGWAFGALFIFLDVFGASRQTDNVAHIAHLGGAAVAFAYFRFRWNLGRLGSFFPKGPKLRIHQPKPETPRDLSKRVDEILEKISREGEASLTKDERRTLEEASRRYQRRKE